MSTQCSPGPPNPLPSPKKTRPVAKKPRNQSNPPWLSPPSTLRGLLPQPLPRQPFHLEINLAEEVTGLSRHSNNEYRTRSRPISERRIRRQWTGCFWSCPVHSTKNRIRDQPDHSGEWVLGVWVWVWVWVCVLCDVVFSLIDFLLATILLLEYFSNFAMVDQFPTAKLTSKYTRSLPERNS